MKNNRGFTLVEIISVIVLLGLIVGITVPSVMTASSNVKKKTLQTKIDNIEEAAVLYGQNNRHLINYEIKSTYNKTTYKYWFKSETLINDCYYYKNGSNLKITVKTLRDASYIRNDDGISDIKNSVDDSQSLLKCKIQIYKKYGKIYAVYDKDTNKTKCWYN